MSKSIEHQHSGAAVPWRKVACQSLRAYFEKQLLMLPAELESSVDLLPHGAQRPLQATAALLPTSEEAANSGQMAFSGRVRRAFCLHGAYMELFPVL